jgi:formylglycine-generating enzyme required for sulfatase activity
VSSITQAKAEAQKLIKRYNKLQEEVKATSDAAEATRKAAEAEKLVSQISALQSAITKLQAKDRDAAAVKKATASPTTQPTTTTPSVTNEDIKRTENEKVALEERMNRLEDAQKRTRAQIEQLTRAKEELTRLKKEAEKSVANVAQQHRANEEKLQQELAKLIQKKEEEHLSLKQELENIRQQAQKEAELLKVQRDAARAMIEKQKEQEDAQTVHHRRSPNKGLFITIGIIAFVSLFLGILIASILHPSREEPVVKQQVPVQAPKPVAAPVEKKPEAPAPVEPLGLYRDPLKGGKGPVMVKLPSGTFQMGSKNTLPYHDERPQHEVTLNSFSIGKFEVTFEEYDWFATATGHPLPNDEGWGRGKRPVINVSWYDAEDYTKWLTEQTGYQYRLASEREWEYAAAAGQETTYWWGYKLETNQANCGVCGSQWDGVQTAPVGSFAPNPFGVHDTIGNVMEWVLDCFHANYRDAPPTGQIWEGGDCSKRTVRSSSFKSYENTLRTTKRYKYTPNTRINILGFRVVRVD